MDQEREILPSPRSGSAEGARERPRHVTVSDFVAAGRGSDRRARLMTIGTGFEEKDGVYGDGGRRPGGSFA